MIEGRKKNKIVDVIFVKENDSFLKHRISNAFNNVDYIVIMISKNIDNVNYLESQLSKWANKLYFVDLCESDFFEMSNLTKLKVLFRNLNISFEDLICFSNTNELPQYENLENLYEQIIYGPVILRQTKFIFNTKLHVLNRHMGTICIEYSFFLKSPRTLSSINESKKFVITDYFNFIDNGYNYVFFQPFDEMLKKLLSENSEITSENLIDCIENNLSPEYLISNIKSPFTSYEESIDFDPQYLKEFFPGNLDKKKVLVFFNIFQIKVPDFSPQEYKKILNFNFTYDYKMKEISIEDNLETINIFLPNNKLYSTENYNFNLFYGLSEVNKKIKKLNLLNTQKVDFLISIPNTNHETISLTWSEIKKSSILEIFYEKLTPFF